MDINKKQDLLISEFEKVSGKSGLLHYFKNLLHLTKAPDIKPEDKTEETLIKSCRQKVWLKSYFENGKVYFLSDSENLIYKSLCNLLVTIFSGHSPKEIVDANIYLFNEICLFDKLNHHWQKDFLLIRQQMKSLAVSHQISVL